MYTDYIAIRFSSSNVCGRSPSTMWPISLINCANSLHSPDSTAHVKNDGSDTDSGRLTATQIQYFFYEYTHEISNLCCLMKWRPKYLHYRRCYFHRYTTFCTQLKRKSLIFDRLLQSYISNALCLALDMPLTDHTQVPESRSPSRHYHQRH
jgi:hypothetical protein